MGGKLVIDAYIVINLVQLLSQCLAGSRADGVGGPHLGL